MIYITPKALNMGKQRAELLAIARKATPGPWKTVGATMVAHFGEDGATICAASEPRATSIVKFTKPDLGGKGFREACANAAHIAAFNPAVAIELLTENAELHGMVARLRTLAGETASRRDDADEKREAKLERAEALSADFAARWKFCSALLDRAETVLREIDDNMRRSLLITHAVKEIVRTYFDNPPQEESK